MFGSGIKLLLISLLFLVLIPFSTLFGLFVYYDTDDPLGLEAFKISYEMFPFKKQFLEFYSPADRNFGANPRSSPTVNEFLIQRVDQTDSEAEISAIVHYFVLQSRTREYDVFVNVSDRVRPLILSRLIERLQDSGSNLSDEIMLLEVTRTGKRIGKGSIWVKTDIAFPEHLTIDERKNLLDERLAATGVKQKYQEWWSLNLSWEEKKRINPLEGTNIKVSECCG